MQDGLSITAVPRAFSVSDLTVSKIYRSLPWREVKRRGIANERGDLIGNCRAGKIEGRLRRKVQLCERRVFGVLFEVGHGPLVHVRRPNLERVALYRLPYQEAANERIRQSEVHNIVRVIDELQSGN